MTTPRIVSAQGSREGQPAPGQQPVSVTSPQGLVSILIPCTGMLEYTKLCVASILHTTRQPYELIFLDIGSLDGTAEYLAGVQTAAPIRIEVISTPTDMGISDVVRNALGTARGQFLVLLNNDTVVTQRWLEHLTGLAEMSPTVGLVGPMSNYAAPPQLVETIPYRIGKKKTGGNPWELDRGAVERFATEHEQANKGKWMEAERLGGFCLLIKRQVLDRIGSEINQWSDLSLFDTDILSSKARQAGFTLACCRDLFIHHFGTRTFAHGAPADKKEQANGMQRRAV